MDKHLYKELHPDRCYWNNEGTICKGLADMMEEIERLESTVSNRCDEVARCHKEMSKLYEALRRIVEEGDYTAPEGMKYIAKDALEI
jgi:hypothetical protein